MTGYKSCWREKSKIAKYNFKRVVLRPKRQLAIIKIKQDRKDDLLGLLKGSDKEKLSKIRRDSLDITRVYNLLFMVSKRSRGASERGSL